MQYLIILSTYRIMRADKKNNISKVANVVLKEPLLTRDEIAIKAWVWQWTVSRALTELDESGRKDPKIIVLTDKDLNCITLWVQEIERRLSEKSELDKMKTFEISQVIRENTARYTLFRWDWTDKEWWSKLPAIIQIINPNEENNI